MLALILRCARGVAATFTASILLCAYEMIE
jgi:hypothetical protein